MPSFQYDFNAEKKALQDYESHMRSLAELQRLVEPVAPSTSAKVESSHHPTTVDMPQFGEPSLSTEAATVSSNSISSTSTLIVKSDGFLPAALLPSASSILQPTPALPVVKSDQDESNSNAVDRRSAQSRIALSLEDFENVQSSPFDALELKTINDIEELRRISTQQQPFLPVNPSQKNGFLL